MPSQGLSFSGFSMNNPDSKAAYSRSGPVFNSKHGDCLGAACFARHLIVPDCKAQQLPNGVAAAETWTREIMGEGSSADLEEQHYGRGQGQRDTERHS
jgi:hypothetical protein